MRPLPPRVQGATSENFSPGEGVMGLGNDDASIIQQLVALKLIDPAFSFCLESSGAAPGRAAPLPGSSVFVFGSASPKNKGLNYTTTPLLTKAGHSYYQVKVSTADLGNGSQVRQGRSSLPAVRLDHLIGPLPLPCFCRSPSPWGSRSS